MKVGDEIGFYYMSGDPTKLAGLSKDTDRYLFLIFPAIGAALLAVDTVLLIRSRRARMAE